MFVDRAANERCYRLFIYAAFMASGAVVTYMTIPETLGRTLEELSNEDQREFIRGAYSLYYPSFLSLLETYRPHYPLRLPWINAGIVS